MNLEQLEQTCKAMLASGKGLLAADTSIASTQKRFDSVGVESTGQTRQEYREILLSTPEIEKYITGVILFDETFWQATSSGQLFREMLQAKNILPGIKVDKGLVDLAGFPGEKITQGLDGLPEALHKYAESGAKFAKWRAVITIGNGIPTEQCITANALTLARYARLCQEENIVPIVEPEVLFEGNHTADECEQAMARTLGVLFKTLQDFRVYLPGTILKSSMVLPGKDSGIPIDHNDVAERTVRVLQEHVPHELGGIVFLSGGQTSDDAFIDLDHIIDIVVQRGPHPWNLTYSYDRALQDPALKAWAKDRSDVAGVQQIFRQQLELASAAARGEIEKYKLGAGDFVTGGQDL